MLNIFNMAASTEMVSDVSATSSVGMLPGNSITVVGGSSDLTPHVGISPANTEKDKEHVRARAIVNRFMGCSPLR
jgi:hypothetical protein